VIQNQNLFATGFALETRLRVKARARVHARARARHVTGSTQGLTRGLGLPPPYDEVQWKKKMSTTENV